MKILLTGAAGFIGAHVYRRLSIDHEVIPVSRHPASILSNTVLLDLTDQNRYTTLPTDVDVIVHLAQSRHHREFPKESSDIFDVNVKSTFHLAEWGRKIGIRKFIFSSSANVYAPSIEPLGEASPIGPDSFYGATKYATEVLLTEYSKFFEIDVLRLFTVFGPGQTKGLVPQILERVISGEPISLQGVNGFTLSPIYVGDVAEALAQILHTSDSNCPTILNLCGNVELSVREIAEILATCLDVRANFNIDGDLIRSFIGDNSLLRTVYRMNPNTSIKQGLIDYLAWRRLELAN